MGDGLPNERLRKALSLIKLREGWGWSASLSAVSNVPEATITRQERGKLSTVSLSVWQRLHNAAPDDIPPPSLPGQPAVICEPSPSFGNRIAAIDHSNAAEIDVTEIPVFDAGAGEPSNFNDGGFPVGQAASYAMIPRREAGPNTFAVRVHGNSMEPTVHQGDIVVVSPERELENGRLCFATWPEDEGQRLIKRYFKYGDVVVLKSDNGDHKEIIVDPVRDRGLRLYRVTKILSVREV